MSQRSLVIRHRWDLVFFKFRLLVFSTSDQRAFIPAFDIHALLPKDLGRFYRYNGSLTTPPCYQSVLWTLFHERVQISKAQVRLEHLSTVEITRFVTKKRSGDGDVRVERY